MAVQDMNNRYVAAIKESTYGTTPSGTYFFGEVDDESIKHTYDVMQRENMNRYGASKANTGKEYGEGDINMAVLNDDFTGLVLLGLMGTDTIGSVASGLYPHTFTEAGVGISMSLAVAREEKIHYYAGAVVEKVSVSAAINEYAMMSASFMTQAEGSLTALSSLSPSFPDDKAALYFSDAKVFFNADSTASDAVKSISFDIALNRDGDAACGLGDRTYVRAPPAQRREITGSIEFNRILHTGAGASNPTYDALISADGLELSGSGVELKVQFGSESVADLLTFNFYKIRFEAPDANVSGRDTQTFTVPFVALYSSNDSKMMDIVMRNDKNAVY
tara:strand:+ start:828 stop:1826 length:999 start_codon:yes stop_codon:yes gene_type:complete